MDGVSRFEDAALLARAHSAVRLDHMATPISGRSKAQRPASSSRGTGRVPYRERAARWPLRRVAVAGVLDFAPTVALGDRDGGVRQGFGESARGGRSASSVDPPISAFDLD